MLAALRAVRASDVHLQLAAEGLQLKYRIDGVLEQIAPLEPPPQIPKCPNRAWLSPLA